MWINYLKTKEKCGHDYSSVIYLYEYHSDDLAQKAMQSVWSKILVDLKNQEGDNIILIPIAVDSEISSLNLITHNFNITNYPVLIIDEKHLIYDLSSAEELGEFID